MEILLKQIILEIELNSEVEKPNIKNYFVNFDNNICLDGPLY